MKVKGERFFSAGMALPLAATLLTNASSCDKSPGQARPSPEATCHVGKRPWKGVVDITAKRFDLPSAAANAGVSVQTMEAGEATSVTCDQGFSPDQIHAYRPVHITKVAPGVGNLCVTYESVHPLAPTAETHELFVACPTAA